VAAAGEFTIPYLASVRAALAGVKLAEAAGGYHVAAGTCERTTEPRSLCKPVPVACTAAMQTAPLVLSWMYCEV